MTALPFTGCMRHNLRRAASGCPTCSFLSGLESRLAAATAGVEAVQRRVPRREVLPDLTAAAERSAAEARAALHGLLLHQGVCCTDRDDNPIPCRFWDAAVHAIEGHGYDMTRFTPALTDSAPELTPEATPETAHDTAALLGRGSEDFDPHACPACDHPVERSYDCNNCGETIPISVDPPPASPDRAPEATPARCPVPRCHAGMLRRGRDEVSCPVCDGVLTVEQWRAMEWASEADAFLDASPPSAPHPEAPSGATWCPGCRAYVSAPHADDGSECAPQPEAEGTLPVMPPSREPALTWALQANGLWNAKCPCGSTLVNYTWVRRVEAEDYHALGCEALAALPASPAPAPDEGAKL